MILGSWGKRSRKVVGKGGIRPRQEVERGSRGGERPRKDKRKGVRDRLRLVGRGG